MDTFVLVVGGLLAFDCVLKIIALARGVIIPPTNGTLACDIALNGFIVLWAAFLLGAN